MDMVVIGGVGHVGLPFGLVAADRGHQVVAYDLDAVTVARVNAGEMPFMEGGAHEMLERVLAAGTFTASTDPSTVSVAEVVVVVIGTPVDEHLNPDPNAVVDALIELDSRFRAGQLVILRSTVFPGVTRKVEAWFAKRHPEVSVAFCPERIAEGFALEEIISLPQLVGARSTSAADLAAEFFASLGVVTIPVLPEEAELAKLFTNTWRYIKFAAANQFWMMANEFGVDFERVRAAITTDYPRAADMPRAGFAAGPCLFKDTMQLAAFSDNSFALGNAAMMINEGLPLYLIKRMEAEHDLSTMTVGILGMAFKGDIDDSRSSLSYKLRKLLIFRAADVLCADPYVVDDRLVAEEEVLAGADLIVIATPHASYRSLSFRQPVVDLWNLTGRGVLI
jgi:UDP-N-acetyl-D-mannosaminuronic acid dehydrogenase